MDDKRYAVLIDSDNISSKYISNILDEMTKYGVITYKQFTVTGNWQYGSAMAMILMVFLIVSLLFGREKETHVQGSMPTAQDPGAEVEMEEEVADV